MRRSIRGKDFKLIFNADTLTPVYKPVVYRQQMKTMQVLDSLQQKKELHSYFLNWFSKNKDRFELYEVSKDFYEVNNLVLDKKYEQIYKTLRQHLFSWIDNSDFGNLSESNMLNFMFGDKMSIPKLNIPKLITNRDGYIIESNNFYTSVGWRNKNEKTWKIYTQNQYIKPKNDFEVLLFRPGYEVLIKSFEN